MTWVLLTVTVPLLKVAVFALLLLPVVMNILPDMVTLLENVLEPPAVNPPVMPKLPLAPKFAVRVKLDAPATFDQMESSPFRLLEFGLLNIRMVDVYAVPEL